MSKKNAIGATIVSGMLALFVPFLSAFISAILIVKVNRTKGIWASSIVVVNVFIGIVNLTVTALAIGTGLALIGIA
ncbi:hypothetical protein [Arcanobacterium buesumense]|uniref:Uncharacterized protein n=1 Tax=Arcanobacterium buesumense TaxID=2722751 RepID=A0A6H2EJY6_9ACTO|nr:hypothetical protein [Arcanobacterium buesumense]QJC21510.1 hypothetical protein HC352_02600 [Arcanobacterium buesumense]